MSGRITIDNLSDSLKETISNSGSGLSEEQVLNLINENGLSEEQVLNLINENGLSEEQVLNLINANGLTEEQVLNLIKNNLTGDLTQLNTANKTNIVAAINELFQSANNGKELIANAIGEPLNSNDTFSAMSTDINGLLSTFKTNMMKNGVTVNSGDKFKALIDKIATLADNEGGLQYVTGNATANGDVSYDFLSSDGTENGAIYIDLSNLGFTPMFVIVTYNNSPTSMSVYIDKSFGFYFSNYMNVKGKSFTILSYSDGSSGPMWHSDNNNLKIAATATGVHTYHAIGVGKEDTTLRDSLASILQEEGVSVTEEDDMASLISKVDSEFTKDNNTISGLESDISNGKSIIANAIGTPLTATDTFTEMGSDINGLLSTFKTNMMNNGVTVNSGDKFKSLIDKIATLANNEGKGIQFASGQISAPQRYRFANINSTHTFSFNEPLNFTPTYLFIRIPDVRYSSTNGSGEAINAIVSNLFNNIYEGNDWANQFRVGCVSSEGVLNIKSVSTTGFVMEGDTDITFGYATSSDYYGTDDVIDWYAIGIGEEDTTLRDSLASILQEEGVSVSEEDDMASLISKVDSEFDKNYKITTGDSVTFHNNRMTMNQLSTNWKRMPFEYIHGNYNGEFKITLKFVASNYNRMNYFRLLICDPSGNEVNRFTFNFEIISGINTTNPNYNTNFESELLSGYKIYLEGMSPDNNSSLGLTLVVTGNLV